MSKDLFFFEPQKLAQLAESKGEAYRSASPVPHIYFDNFLPEDIANTLVEEFPAAASPIWKRAGAEQEVKLSCEDETKFGPVTRHIISQLNSGPFVAFLEQLTGIKGLIPDPHLRGGGLHQIERGGFLKIHVDFNWYPRLRLTRRLNLLVYLNKDWEEAYGGHFELWDKEMKNSLVKILPIFNRAALFSTSEESYHGHPNPLTCPPGMSRKSIALYYYTSDAPEEAAVGAHTTLFQKRPGETWKNKGFLRDVVKEMLPPVIYKAIKQIARRGKK